MNSFDLLFSHLEYSVLCRLWVERHDEACVERASDQLSEYRSSQCLFGFGLGLPEMSRFTKLIWKSFLGTIWYCFRLTRSSSWWGISHREYKLEEQMSALSLAQLMQKRRKEGNNNSSYSLWVLNQIAASALPSRWLLCWNTIWDQRASFRNQQLMLIVGSEANCSISFAIQMTLMLKHYLRPESELYCKNLVLITEGKIHAYPNSNSF